MDRAKVIAAGMVIAVAFLTGCQCQMTGLSASSVPVTANDSYTIIGPVSSYSWGCLLAGALPLCESNPSGKCLERALKKSGGNALIEVSEDTMMMFIPYVYPYRTRLQGTAVKLVRGGAKQ